MFKKILIILLILAVAGAGGYGTYHYYSEYKSTTEQLRDVNARASDMQSRLEAIGTMGTAYQLVKDVKSGAEITVDDFRQISVPTSTVGAKTYTDFSQVEAIVGRHYRSPYSAGTILTEDIIMTEEEEQQGIMKYPMVLGFDSLPVQAEPGAYMDLRFYMANGEEYVVLDQKIIQDVKDTNIQIYCSEEEIVLLNALYSDTAVYSNVCLAYIYVYLEPGNADTVAFYPCLADQEAFLKFNPNITDPTRCINSTLRAHIDQQLLILADSANAGVSSAIVSRMSGTLASQESYRQAVITERQQQQNVQQTTQPTEETQESTYDPDAIE